MKLISRGGAWSFLIMILVVGGTSRPVAAQASYSFGTYPWTAPIPVTGGYMDAADGNLHIEIPVAAIPGRGHIPFVAKLVYDSHVWVPTVVNHVNTWQPVNVANSTLGWRLVTSGDSGTVTNSFLPKTCMYGRVQYPYVIENQFVYHSPDGHTIPFGVTTTDGQGAPCAHDSPSADGVASDASGYQIHVTNYTVATIFAPDGTQVVPKVEDSNGNYYSSDANGNPIDTLAWIIHDFASKKRKGALKD